MDSYMKQPMSVRRTVDVEIQLTENDIFNWLTQCDDPETLDRVARWCRKYAQGIRGHVDDDFRSRA